MVAVLRKERRVVKRFRETGATSAPAARRLEDLQLRRGLGLRRLRERAVIREASPEHYYLDEEMWAALGRRRRRVALFVLAIALVLVLAGLGVGWLTSH